MRREYGDYIEDIIESIKKIKQFTKDISYQNFKKDEKTIFVIVRA